jgi:alkylglycerol monooxygenase
MELYGKILLIAMPIFLALVLLEKFYGWLKGEDNVPTMDMISSLSSGVTNVVKDVLGLSVAIISYGKMLPFLTVYKVETTVYTYIIAFMVLDFSGYWLHRWSHKINFLWNKHAIHHSSEEFNLACALRQTLSVFVKLFFFLLIPAAVLGVPEKVIEIVGPIHLFAQFWYHTKHIDRMGFLEHIIVTPSHHRVHHAINPIYIDKNFAEIFIFWDKWFGTFQEELPEEPPVYGITVQANTWNPIKINFQHLWLLAQDAWHAEDWMDKIRIWYMPTGWRPADVAANYPIPKIEDSSNFQKYSTATTPLFTAWIITQFVFTTIFVFYFFGNIASIGKTGTFCYGAFIFLTVYSYTELMDHNKNAIYWEILKVVVGMGFIYPKMSWFGIDAMIPFATYAIMGYFALSLAMTFYFVKNRGQILKMNLGSV